MAKINHPQQGIDALLAELAELKRRLSNLERSARAGNTSVDSGQFTVKTPGGTVTFMVGNFGPAHSDGTPQTSLLVSRENGVPAFAVRAIVADGPQYTSFVDQGDHIYLGEDPLGGLAAPYIPVQWSVNPTVAEVTTTSASFVTAYRLEFFRFQPGLRVRYFYIPSDGSTTGEVRVQDLNGAGTLIGPQALPAGGITQGILTTTLLGGTAPAGLLTECEVQIRRTAGAGTVGLRLLQATGIESFT
jgi:hypothetical protein